jgi:putative membrane protein
MKAVSIFLLAATALFANTMDMPRLKAPLLDIEHILAVLIYSVMGIIIMVLAFVIIDWIHPRDIWGEIADKQNTAMAIVFGCLMIGIGIIIAAAVVG